MKLTWVVALVVFLLPLAAQTGGKSEVFSAKDVKAKLATMAPQAKTPTGSTAMLGDYKTHSIRLVARTTSGGAEVHNHFDDVIVVTEGSATIITGGSVVNPHDEADGEIRGQSVKDGQSQAVSVGDVIHIPAGTPHQTVVPAGKEYSAMVVKVREQ
jgi:mannose-6-phosphate isomerase-like protein (cupin superfamily)